MPSLLGRAAYEQPFNGDWKETLLSAFPGRHGEDPADLHADTRSEGNLHLLSYMTRPEERGSPPPDGL